MRATAERGRQSEIERERERERERGERERQRERSPPRAGNASNSLQYQSTPAPFGCGEGARSPAAGLWTGPVNTLGPTHSMQGTSHRKCVYTVVTVRDIVIDSDAWPRTVAKTARLRWVAKAPLGSVHGCHLSICPSPSFCPFPSLSLARSLLFSTSHTHSEIFQRDAGEM